ncbi:hypothetical protein K1T71_004028 [Dendrolimus kikuchii]|uniref:Uncharacterized protein n=1 Tax=Dendrolimus kikuchii TaxID=765133 RepID=A0ACC1DA27_9NEOP|nr:hypothetical protein K1T71_004028 [Dendrolimus kikuchii]
MRRKDPTPMGRGKSLISTRTSQQQRKIQMSRNLLPRSYSSPASQNDHHSTESKAYVMRSFSSPEPKHLEYRRNSDSFYRPKAHGSRSELDSDLENFEQFEDSLIDIDADQDETAQYRSSPEKDEPKRVVTTLLPGSGLHRVTLRPIPSTTQSLYCARDATKKMQREDSRGLNRLNFRPLVVKMPARDTIKTGTVNQSQGVEELQTSPQLEIETSLVEQEMTNAEQQLEKGAAIATEESDADTVREGSVVCKATSATCASRAISSSVQHPAHVYDNKRSASNTKTKQYINNSQCETVAHQRCLLVIFLSHLT